MDSDSSDCIIISYMRCKFKLYHSFSQIIFHEPLLFVHESLLSVFSLCFTLQNVASLSFLQDKNVRSMPSLWKKISSIPSPFSRVHLPNIVRRRRIACFVSGFYWFFVTSQRKDAHYFFLPVTTESRHSGACSMSFKTRSDTSHVCYHQKSLQSRRFEEIHPLQLRVL